MKAALFLPMFLMGLFSYNQFWLLEINKNQKSVQKSEYKIKFSSTDNRKIVLNMDKSDIDIAGYDGDEVVISVTGDYNTTPPDRAKGLKALYQTGEDNTGLGLAVSQENNTITINKITNRGEPNYRVKVPRKISVVFEEINHHGHEINISGIEGNIRVNSKSSAIRLKDINGSVEASSIGGDINVEFARLSQENPSSFKVVGSTIDVVLPASTKADIRMKSISGEIYTDFDLGTSETKDGLKKVAGGRTIEGKANGGGVALNLESIGSDIFIRKKK
jgi:hypothetical protein